MPLLRRLDRVVPMTISVPIVWVSLEYLRADFLTGFAWYFLGHSQHDYLAIIQIADLGGVYAITALVAAGNGLLFEFLCRSEKIRSFARICRTRCQAGRAWAFSLLQLLSSSPE